MTGESLKTLVLKPGREKSVLRRHPWIFSGAVAKVEGSPEAGETVEVLASDGKPLGVGAYSPQSQIVARMWDFDPATRVTADFVRSRLQVALSMRQALGGVAGTAGRLVNAESDGLPGLVIDRYADFLVCQFLSAGAERWKGEVVQLLGELVPCRGIYERSDVDVREKEGLPPATGVLAGSAPDDPLEIEEGACHFWVDLKRGHKTGFYLDQRENRAIVGGLAGKREVLNCFAYTGGFAVYALRAGASQVINVDTSAAALDLAQRNMELNEMDLSRAENVEGDVFRVLRSYRDARRQFDLIVLDPPKFAESHSQIERATRGYKDINLLAFKLLRSGGLLATFSCSGLIRPDLFQKIVAGAALDAGRDAQILRRLSQSPDHPVALNFPEGEYLKGLICRVA